MQFITDIAIKLIVSFIVNFINHRFRNFERRVDVSRLEHTFEGGKVTIKAIFDQPLSKVLPDFVASELHVLTDVVSKAIPSLSVHVADDHAVMTCDTHVLIAMGSKTTAAYGKDGAEYASIH